MQRANSWYSKAVEWLWCLLVLFLPLTSVPIVSKITGSANVAPASGILLIILFIIWFIPYVVKNGKIALQLVPLLSFFLFAIFSTAAAFFLYSPSYKNNSILSSSIKGIVTLILGVAFYVVASTILRKRELLQKTLQMINWGGTAFIIWSAIQFIFWLIFNEAVTPLRFLQSLVSSGRLYYYRVTGFALEPSWLAHTLNIVYLPYWLAATIEKTSAHKFRFRGITFENILLAAGIVTLVLTFSRVGWVAFLLMLFYVFIRLIIKFAKWILQKSTRRNPISKSRGILFTALISVGLIIVYLGILVGIVFLATKIDVRMAKLLDFSNQRDNPVLRYANSLKFGERLIYWISGWRIFNDYPILGVGLGNAGFYMPSRIIPYGWSLMEVQGLIYQSPALLNIKSLWFRLPAETGIIGLVLFMTWLYLIFKSARVLQKQQNANERTLGSMGIFMLIGLILEGVSVDSFALPYIWITAGIVTAGSVIVLNRQPSAKAIKN